MFFKLLAVVCACGAASAREGDLVTQVLKGYFQYDLKVLHEFYIPDGQCSGLIERKNLMPPDCLTNNLNALRVSVRDWPNYAVVQMSDDLNEVTIRRREFRQCEGKALVKVEVQCKGLLTSDRSKRADSQKTSDNRQPRALPSIAVSGFKLESVKTGDDQQRRAIPSISKSRSNWLKSPNANNVYLPCAHPDIPDIGCNQRESLKADNVRLPRVLPDIGSNRLETLKADNVRLARALPDIPDIGSDRLESQKADYVRLPRALPDILEMEKIV